MVVAMKPLGLMCGIIFGNWRGKRNLRLIEGKERLRTFGSYREIFTYSQSDYLCQIDADDALAPAALERSVKLIDAYEGASFLYTDCIDMDVMGAPLGCLEGNRFPIPNKIFWSNL